MSNSNHMIKALVAITDNPEILLDFVGRTGLTARFVTTELRRLREFLTTGRVNGRQSISYRVLRELMEYYAVVVIGRPNNRTLSLSAVKERMETLLTGSSRTLAIPSDVSKD